MTGLELLSWAKNQPDLETIPFVLLTASADETDRSFASQLGADAYLVKTGNLNELYATVQQIHATWCASKLGNEQVTLSSNSKIGGDSVTPPASG
jgi:CheY-like chemotaxis protein